MPISHSFEIICDLAKQQNEPELIKLLNAGVCLSEYKDDHNPISFLAMQGNVKAVNFLINKFHANLNHAVKGYAIGGYVEQVNQLIAQGANSNVALKGYAQGGHIEQVIQLLDLHANYSTAAEGYARGGYIEQVNQMLNLDRTAVMGAIRGYAQRGYVEQVNQLLNRDPMHGLVAIMGYSKGGHVEQVNQMLAQRRGFGPLIDFNIAVMNYAQKGYIEQVNQLLHQSAGRNLVIRDFAVMGYARGGHIEQVNQLLNQGADRNRALEGYAQGGHIEQVNQLLKQGADRKFALNGYKDGEQITQNPIRLLSLINDEKLRKQLADEAKTVFPSLNTKSLLKQAEKLNLLMQKNNLNFHQAQAYLAAAANVWFFQGQQIAPSVFPSEIYKHILSYAVECSEKDTMALFLAANQNLRDRVIDASHPGIFSNSKSQNTLNRLADAEKRYQKRIGQAELKTEEIEKIPECMELLEYILTRNKEFWEQKQFLKQTESMLAAIALNREFKFRWEAVCAIAAKLSPPKNGSVFSSSSINPEISHLLSAIQNADVEELKIIKKNVVQTSLLSKRTPKMSNALMMHKCL